jgi:hypothetical protein
LSNPTELEQQIADFLEVERTRHADAARAAGIPASVRKLVAVATPETSESSLQVTYDEVAGSSAADMTVAQALARALPQRSGLSLIAQCLVDMYGEGCRVWNPILQPAWDEEPAQWVQQRLLSPLVWDYLGGLASLDRGDEVLAARLAHGLLELVSGDRVTFVTSLALAGLAFEKDTMSLGEFTFRRLSPRELGSLIDERSLPGSYHRRVVPPLHEPLSERWAMEVRTACPKTVQPLPAYRPDCLLLALQLLGYEPHGRGRARTWTEPGPSIWDGGQRYRLPKYGTTAICSEEGLARAIRLADRIPEGAFTIASTAQEVALHRFLLGSAEEVVADAVIDYAISLEAALLQDNKELAFKLRLFGACYLEAEAASRRAVFDRLRALYGVRSNLVHGNARVDADVIAQAAHDGREIAGRVLGKALEEGWPTPEQLQDLAIS